MASGALEDIDAVVDAAMEEWQVPGLALAIVVDGEPTVLKAYGQRDVEANLLVTINTQFTICSITKSFTAAGLGMLIIVLSLTIVALGSVTEHRRALVRLALARPAALSPAFAAHHR